MSQSSATLSKTGGAGWNVAASGSLSLASGDGSFDFSVPALGDVAVGLSTRPGFADATLDFALRLGSDRSVTVVESGVATPLKGTYKAGDRFRVAVEAGSVKYYRSGSVVYTSSRAVRYPLAPVAALYTAGITIQDAVLSGLTVENVEWTRTQYALGLGNSLAKSGGVDNAWDAFASATRGITGPGGDLEFAAPDAPGQLAIGLSPIEVATPKDLHYAVSFDGDGTATAIERGTTRASTSYTPGDRFRIAVENGAIVYRKNGVALASSPSPSEYPLLICAALRTRGVVLSATVIGGDLVDVAQSAPRFVLPTGHYAGVQRIGLATTGTATIHYTTNGSDPTESDRTVASTDAISVGQDVTLKARAWHGGVAASGVSSATYTFGATASEAVTWTRLVNAGLNQGRLTKTDGAEAVWNAGAASTRAITSADGYLEVVTDQTSGELMFGLSSGDKDQSFHDIAFAIGLEDDTIRVYESGQYRGSFGKFAAGDRLRVSIENGMVRYRRNGVLLYTSTVAPALPLIADTSFYRLGSDLRSATLVGRLADAVFPAPAAADSFADWLDAAGSSAYPQSAPAGAVPLSPSGSIPQGDLKLWLQADVGITKDGSNRVSTWSDQSGLANNAAQTTQSAQPIWVADSGGGVPAVRFDGVNDALSLATRITTGRTAFLVVRNSNSTGYRAPLGDNTTAQTYTSEYDRQIWRSNDPASVIGGETRLNGTPIDGTIVTYPSYSSPLATVTSVATASVATTYVGRAKSTGYFWLGDISEVIVYDRVLTVAERHQVEEYLMRKYGSVPNLPPSAPSFTPNGGTFTGSVSVTLSTTTAGATIRYTTDGTEPSATNGNSYLATPITVNASTTIRAKAFLGSLESRTTVAGFTKSTDVNPASIGGLQLWLRGDAGVDSTDGWVNAWRDQSGHGNDATQARSGSIPPLLTDATSSLPALHFDGLTSWMSLNSSLTTGRTVFMVLRLADGDPQDITPLGTTTGYTYNTGWSRQIWDWSNDPATVTNGETWLNGAPVNSDEGAEYPPAAAPLAVVTSIATGSVTTSYVGRGATSSTYWEGDIAEVVVYDRALTGPERHQVEEYLMRKYASVADLAPSAPSATPNGGVFSGSVEVSLATTTPGTTIRYTTNGSEPSLTNGSTYSSPIQLSASATVRAKAYIGPLASATTVVGFLKSTDFNPTSLTGLQLWLRSDAGVDPAGGYVTGWRDQSGLGNDATRTSSSTPPAFTTDADGIPVARFDGGNNSLTLNTRITTGRTVFIALRNSAPASGYAAPLGDQTTQTYRSGYAREFWATGDSAYVTGGGTYLNGTQVLDGRNSSYPFAGSPLALLASIATGSVPTQYVGSESGGSYPWLGDIAEVVIYTRALTTPERQQVEQYLRAKYSTPKPGIQHRQSSTGESGTWIKPVVTVPGDVMLVHTASYSPVTAPSGWTRLAEAQLSGTYGGWWYRSAAAVDNAISSYAFGNAFVTLGSVYTGVDGSQPIGAFEVTPFTGTNLSGYTHPGISLTSVNSTVVAEIMEDASSGEAFFGDPAGFTKVQVFGDSFSESRRAYSSSGAIGPQTWTWPGQASSGIAALIELRAPSSNRPPTANAGPDQVVTFPSQADLSGSATDDGLPSGALTYTWSKVAGPGGPETVTFGNPSAATTTASFSVSGVYVLRLTVSDGAAEGTDDVKITENQIPVVNVGQDQLVTFPTQVNLHGTATDDGLPSGALTYTWSKVTGPGGPETVTFGDPNAADTTASFSAPGLYKLRLAVSDGAASGTGNVSVTQNQAPVVNAGPDLVVTLPGAARLYGSATDDGLPTGSTLSCTWTKYSGPGAVTFANPSAADTTATFSVAGDYVLRLAASDGAASGSDDVVVTVAAGQATLVRVSITPSTALLAPSAQRTFVATATYSNGQVVDVTASATWSSTAPTVVTVNAGQATGQVPGLANITASYDGRNASAKVEVADGTLPPDPAVVAPPLDPTVASTLGAASAFIYSGSTPIQTGVVAGVVDPLRVSVLRGRVTTRDGSALSGVTVRILDHPELGATRTRIDGAFDLVVNGGGALTVNFDKAGYLPTQRQTSPRWQESTILPAVVMIGYDTQVTTVDFGGGTAIQTAQASVVTDSDGTRRATILVPPGTTGALTLPGGGTQALTTAGVRATEYTVGTSGVRAMPGTLPPSSGYTYAIELSLDEAIAAGATGAVFNQPVINYTENFLDFPVGLNVPVGYYDRTKGAWIPSADGRVVKVVSVTGGVADLDIDGSGTAAGQAALEALGVSDAERTRLALLYGVGQSLWRVPVSHFSPYDYNWPFGPPADATAPDGTPGTEDGGDGDDPDCKLGSIIECQTQNLGESVQIAGTPFTLEYRSSRTPGRAAAKNAWIPLTGATSPASLKRIDLEVTIGGQYYSSSFTPQADLSTRFEWDGKDGYGRPLLGSQPATIRVGYVYDGVYRTPSADRTLSAGSPSFGLPGGAILTGSRTRQEVTVASENQLLLGAWDARADGLGGWTLDIQHHYDSNGRVLHLGSGHSVRPAAEGDTIQTVAGNGNWGGTGDGGPATDATFYSGPQRVAVGSDGSLYVVDLNRVRRVLPNGTIVAFAGTGEQGYSGDGGLATLAAFQNIDGIAVGKDGTVYIADGGNNRVRRVTLDGIVSTFAGTGVSGSTGDGGPAVNAQLATPTDVVAAPDGAVYISEHGPGSANGLDQFKIRRVSPDGTIASWWTGSTYPGGLTLGADGSFYYWGFQSYSTNAVWRLSPDGSSRYLGNVSGGGLGVDRSGNVFSPHMNGIIEFSQGASFPVVFGYSGFGGDGGPAGTAQLSSPMSVTVGPDNNLYIADLGNYRVRRVGPILAGVHVAPFTVASKDGSELYTFSSDGRHVNTIHALTGSVIRTFGYNGDGLLTSITDGDQNVTSIERGAGGLPTAIVAPGGQRTTLETDVNGYLTTIRDPGGNAYNMQSDPNGLLRQWTDPRVFVHPLEYDDLGRLSHDANPVGGSWSASRTGTPGDSTVTLASAMGRTSTYRVQFASGGNRTRVNTDPAGLATTTNSQYNAWRYVTTPDGTSTTANFGGDPRWGMQAPLTTALTVHTPGGLTTTVAASRTASLSNPGYPLSLQTLTDTFTLNGKSFMTTYTAATRTRDTVSPMGRHTTEVIDTQGRVVEQHLPGVLLPITHQYTGGRLTGISWGERSLSIGYDTQLRPNHLQDSLLRTWGFEYDAADRLKKQVLPDNREINFGYDAAGNVTSVQPPGRPDHGFTYSAIDRPESYVPPDLGTGAATTTYADNLDRQPRLTTRPDGKTAERAYDPTTGRLQTVTTDRGVTSYSYYPATGNLQTITAPDGGTVSYGYDGSLLTSTTWTGPVSGSVSRAYDNNLRMVSESVNGGNAVTYEYDDDGLLTRAGDLIVTRYPNTSTRAGLISGTTLGNVTDSYEYNDYGEVSRYTARFQSTELFDAIYHRDAAGRIDQITETIDGVTRVFGYEYYSRGWLKTVRRNGDVIASYTYDDNGNRLTADGERGSFTGAYNNRDQMTSYGGATFAYSLAGEMVGRTDGQAVTTYDFDATGIMRGATLPDATAIAYVIDAAGNRVGKRVSGALVERRLYGRELEVVADLDGAGAVASRYVSVDPAGSAAYFVRGSQTYRIISDHLGTARIVVDVTTGTVAQRLDFTEWGEVRQDSNPGFQPFSYTGREWDNDTRLGYYRARYYDPKVGRFVSEDPVGQSGGDVNLYSYVFSDPMAYLDPSGEGAIAAAGSIMGGTAGFIAGGGLALASGGTLTPGMVATTAVGSALGLATGLALEQALDATRRLLEQPLQAEHTKEQRPSTEEKHEKGEARKGRDQGMEKADSRRRPPRFRPDWWPKKDGPWPPSQEEWEKMCRRR